MTPSFVALPFGLGDVLVAESGDEAWLAGAVVCAESAPIAYLFRAPSGGHDRAVYLRAVPPIETAWLESSALERGPLEPPTSLEIGGEIYARVRRLPVTLSRIGEASFDLDGLGVLAEYRGPGAKRAVRLATRDAVLLAVGRVLLPGTYDRLPARAPDA